MRKQFRMHWSPFWKKLSLAFCIHAKARKMIGMDNVEFLLNQTCARSKFWICGSWNGSMRMKVMLFKQLLEMWSINLHAIAILVHFSGSCFITSSLFLCSQTRGNVYYLKTDGNFMYDWNVHSIDVWISWISIRIKGWKRFEFGTFRMAWQTYETATTRTHSPEVPVTVWQK